MALEITKLANGNVSFYDATNKWSYSEPYVLRLEGDFVSVVSELSRRVVYKMDWNDVGNVISPVGGTVATTSANQLYLELFNNVFFKKV